MKYEWIYGIHTYNISDSVPFEIVAIDGIDLATVQAITEQGPLQDGDSDRDMRLIPRTIQMVVQAMPSNTYSIEDIRRTFNRIFVPSKILGTLRITTNDDRVYDIAARPMGNAGARRSITDDMLFRAGVAFRCPDPLWHNPDMQVVNFGVSAGGGSFTVPTLVPTGVGSSTIDQTEEIAYNGTYRTFPVIQLYGPISSPVITNVTTGRSIAFPGVSIGSGDYYTIDLRYGRKIVYKNGNTSDNRTGEATGSLATFTIEADPLVSDGINVIQVTGTGATSVTAVYIQYYEMFGGI